MFFIFNVVMLCLGLYEPLHIVSYIYAWCLAAIIAICGAICFVAAVFVPSLASTAANITAKHFVASVIITPIIFSLMYFIADAPNAAITYMLGGVCLFGGILLDKMVLVNKSPKA